MEMKSNEEKVIEYETFLNDRLKNDLRKILDLRDKIYEDISEYMQLKTTIQKLQEDLKPQAELKTKIDLGCNFYVQANVTNPSMIFVSIGFGFFLEMTLTEAVSFIEKKTERLQSQAIELTHDASKVKGHIKLVIEGLRELQNLPKEEETTYRDVLS
ncbi:unnamed protein product [Lymnaea stagnalis]|uniref:Protein UXT n=1 Tax=Lymnaea stagnalis TaxID=6523 RepID=A0AAV2HHT1_LYMST